MSRARARARLAGNRGATLIATFAFCCAVSLASATTTIYYDAAGRYAGHDNATGSLSLTRDALGRVSEQEASAPVLNVAFPTQFAHDEEGRLLWLRDRRGKTAEMRYDEAGRLTWLNHGQTTCSGSSIGQSIGPTTEWTYDDRDRVESVTHRGPPPGVGIPGPVLLSRTYERNAAGEPTRILEQDGSYTEVDYDPAGRVQAERYFDEVDTLLETITYTYDLDGNRTSRTSSAGLEVYEYDSGSRLTRVTLDGVETQRFEYDENGRVSRIVRDGLDQRLHWDALDRLVRVEDLSFLEDAVDFAYDGQGRRVSADRADSAQRYVVGPTGNQSLESPHLVHNGFFLTGELVYGGEHALWRYDGSEPPDTRVYLRDAMGSVIGLMDGEGHLLETFEYDAFGNVRSPGGEALPEVNLGGDSRFQGMWKDAGTGLYYVRARYYDPRTGRFLSRDPAEGELETPESLQPYRFAGNNPFVFGDPTGLTDTTFESQFAAVQGAASIYPGSATAAQGFIRSLQAVRTVAAVGAGVATTQIESDKPQTQQPTTFSIIDGVRRAKAAQTIGLPTVNAYIQVRGVLGSLQTVPIGLLLSPKPSIEIRTPAQISRWTNAIQSVGSGAYRPIIITPSNLGVPLAAVKLVR